jgi:type IV pilus assembly protein PilY1
MIRDAGKYYKGQGDYTGGYTTSPIELECQPNFIILVSDGLQNGKVDVRTEATYRRTQDHSSFTGTQNVLVHTVGFAVAAGEEDAANDVLETAATNGGGTFYSTNNETQLEAALEDAIRQIVAATFAFATPVIPTTSATGVSRTFMAAFQSDPSRPYWRGYLKAFNRDSNGNVPVDDTGVPCGPDFSTHTPCTASALAWEAGSVLNTKAAADRVIKTVVAVGGPLVSFDTSNVTAAMLDVASSAEQSKLINFIRGVDTYDEDLDGNTTEQREWKLGDIFHSTPVLVTPPRAPTPESDTVSGSYAEFKKQKEGRTTILVAGSNDGMLHAFRENNGEEIWAFVPPTLPLTGPAPFSKLKDLVVPGGDHQYFADGNPLATDVKISIPSDSTIRWRTIVIFGLRRGGHLYYALDITNTENPIYMWSFTDSKMGETWSTPTVGKVKMADGTDKYVAFVAGGYDTAENNTSGKAVFAIDIATGTKLWEYSAASTGGGSMNFSIPADMTAMDVDANDYIDRLYVGDVGGQVWKFDVSAAATVSGTPALVDNWTGKRIFAANLASETTNPPATGEYYPGQAIYGSIIPAYDNASPKNLWIYFGAGDRNHPNKCTGTLAECPTDPPLRPLNRFYGIKENTSMTGTTPIVESDLVNITNTSDLTPGQGWYYELATREKILASAEIFNKVVYFSSFTPTTTTACASGGGTAKLYAVWMLTGYAALDWSRPGTELANNTDHTEERGKPIGTGIPTRPIVVITEDGATIVTSVIAATTSQQLPSNLTTPPPNMRGVRYWREVFN